ncbi:MAG: hypothetical protein WBV95_15505 [Desulfobacterales bacterium]
MAYKISSSIKLAAFQASGRAEPGTDQFRYIGFKIKVLDCVIGRRRITIQPSPSGLAKNFILKPIDRYSAFKWISD